MNITSKTEVVEKYLTDESNAFVAPPDSVSAVYFPETASDLVSILKEANNRKQQCTLSGAGTSITGSRVPMYGGIVISTERLVRADPPEGWTAIEHKSATAEVLIAINKEERLAKVPAGVSLDTLSSVLPGDLLYPPDPTEPSSFVGGTVATNASGARSFSFGPTRAWVDGLTVVLPNGDLLVVNRGETLADREGFLRFRGSSGREYEVRIPSYRMPKVKNAAGLYTAPGMDLIDLFIGSEGILGAIVDVRLRLIQRPAEILADVAFFGSEPDALAFADSARRLREQGVISIEYFDASSLHLLRDNQPRLQSGWVAAVMLELIPKTEEALDTLFELLKRHNAKNDWSGKPDQFKEFRHSLPETINSYLRQCRSHKLGTDFVVPARSFQKMMQAYRSAGEAFRKRFPRNGLHYVVFGHIGEYHLHFNFIAQTGEEMAFARKLYVKLAQEAIALGGTVSGEHGVGKKTVEIEGQPVPYLQLMYGRKGLLEIARIKRALDPNLILNLGNMVPRELL